MGRESACRAPDRSHSSLSSQGERETNRSGEWKSCVQVCQDQGWLPCLEQTLVEFFSLQADTKFRIPGEKGPPRASVFVSFLTGKAPPDMTVSILSSDRCRAFLDEWHSWNPSSHAWWWGDRQGSAQSHRQAFGRGSWITFYSCWGHVCLFGNFPCVIWTHFSSFLEINYVRRASLEETWRPPVFSPLVVNVWEIWEEMQIFANFKS